MNYFDKIEELIEDSISHAGSDGMASDIEALRLFRKFFAEIENFHEHAIKHNDSQQYFGAQLVCEQILNMEVDNE